MPKKENVKELIRKPELSFCQIRYDLLRERYDNVQECLESLKARKAKGDDIFKDQASMALINEILKDVAPEPYEELVGWIDDLEDSIPEEGKWIEDLEKCYDEELENKFSSFLAIAEQGAESALSLEDLSTVIEFYNIYFLKRGALMLEFLKEG